MAKKRKKTVGVVETNTDGESAHFSTSIKMSSDFNGWGFTFGRTVNRQEGESQEELNTRVADLVMGFVNSIEDECMTQLGDLTTTRKRLHERTHGRGR